MVALKRGPLSKEGESRYFWNPRYFVLEETCLKYYTDEDAANRGELRGSIMLLGAVLMNTKTPRSGKLAFRLEGSGASATKASFRGSTGAQLKFILAGSTLEDTLDWVAALEQCGVTSTFDPWPMCSTPPEVQQLRAILRQRASTKAKESTSTVPPTAATGGQPAASLATAAAPPGSPPASQKMQEASALDRWLATLSKCMRCAPQPP